VNRPEKFEIGRILTSNPKSETLNWTGPNEALAVQSQISDFGFEVRIRPISNSPPNQVVYTGLLIPDEFSSAHPRMV
jgi:hypothetical protein